MKRYDITIVQYNKSAYIGINNSDLADTLKIFPICVRVAVGRPFPMHPRGMLTI